jgi:hypothetical protein
MGRKVHEEIPDEHELEAGGLAAVSQIVVEKFPAALPGFDPPGIEDIR